MDFPDWVGLSAFAAGYFAIAFLMIEVLRLSWWVNLSASAFGGIMFGLIARYAAGAALS